MVHVSGQVRLQGFPIVRIGRTGVRSGAERGFRKRPVLLFPEAGVHLVFQKSSLLQGLDQMPCRLAGPQIPGQADQPLAKVEVRLPPVETAQALDQQGRDNQRDVRVLQRIADQ